MARILAAVVASALLVAGGLAHGLWTHRWVPWDEVASEAARTRLERVPTAVGTWGGERLPGEPLDLPEEVTGRGVSFRFTDRTDGAEVYVYVASGPTEAMALHVPTVCYPANGYRWCPPDLRVDPATGTDADAGPRFWVSGFSRVETGLDTHLRVYWAWSDGRGWRVPANPLKEFRRSPVLFKCYLCRVISNPDEPLAGEPCGRLWAALQPELDRALFGDQ